MYHSGCRKSIYFMQQHLAELHDDIVAVLHDPMFKKHTRTSISKITTGHLVDLLIAALKPLVSATEM